MRTPDQKSVRHNAQDLDPGIERESAYRAPSAPWRPSDRIQLVQMVSDTRFAHGVHCVRCNGTRVIRWGSYQGRTRYRCRHCGRTFTALTNTPFAYTKRLSRWPSYLKLMRAQTTLRRAAARLDIHLSTSFRWRHRILGSAFGAQTRLAGYVELTETLFPYSEKGSRRICGRAAFRRGGRADPMEWASRRRVRVVLLLARCGGSAGAIVGGNVLAVPQLTTALTSLLAPDTVIVAMIAERGAWASAINSSGRELQVPAAAPRLPVTLLHVRNVRSFERRLHSWLLPFRGVATKYLANYMAWHRFAEHDDATAWLCAFVRRTTAPVPFFANSSREHSGCVVRPP